MNADERQVRILEFVESYQRQNGDAPTIRELVRGSGVSTLANIGPDVETLVRKGLLAFVTEKVSGSEPFTSRQVRLAGPATRRAAAPGAASPLASPGPGPAGAAPRGGRPQHPLPSTASAPAPGKPPPRRSRRLGPRSGPTSGAPRRSASRSSLADSPPLRAALIAAILATLLLIGARIERAPLPVEPAMRLGSRSIPLVVPGAVLAWALGGGLLSRAALRDGAWRWQGLLRPAAVGLGTGLFVQAYEQLLRPLLTSLETSGLPTLIDSTIRMLPALLPATAAPTIGAASIGILTAELPKLLGGSYNYPLNNLVMLPLVVLPLELMLLSRGRRRDLRTMLAAGALVGLSQVLVLAVFLPGAVLPGQWPAMLATALVGGLAAGWLATWIRDTALGVRDRLPGRAP